ncbi:peptidyl-Asp metalloendopeptidase [Herbihabitans rhizosphaerae]|uniref:Peptidyl-Asp metalloendopeptidase n=1 Tax=Herbihabitans rhizosphaerae TaxID=1872711 RepID=A0A4Q7KDW9_9PSEU|nr:M12 family metallo-peptidase [Herbihabitans rhizosphaerae]RZS32434.1 peptidyl-Asp metalloendopeptidase [Herbihabitans rhizosphaerae]
MQRRHRTLPVLVALGLGAAALALVPTAAAEAGGAPALFTGDAVAARAADGLRSTPYNAEVRVKQANPDVVAESTEEIAIDLGGRTVHAVRDGARRTEVGNTLWTGQIRETAKARGAGAEVATDENNSVTLVRSDAGVTGSVRLDGKLYKIRPVSGGHAVIAVDETKMPRDHAPIALPKIDMPAAEAAPAANTVIRVQVVATNEAVSAYGGDMRALTDLAVAETNKGYTNSGVGITLELASYSTVNYNEQGFSTDLSRFRGTSDGQMDGIHAIRDQTRADVGVLIINDSSYCGLASGIGSSASTAFAAVYWDCATGYYSFGHEIGHLQSARHDPATDGSNTPYAYGHGYRYGTSWRTIMAYNCSPSCPRLNYWSNPRVNYQGVPMGTTTRSDNARVLENTKATVAGFRS